MLLHSLKKRMNCDMVKKQTIQLIRPGEILIRPGGIANLPGRNSNPPGRNNQSARAE